MKRLSVFLWLVSSPMLGLSSAQAAGSAGTEPFGFLFLDADARAVGFGGAYTALASDANALLYNPAGLGMIRRSEAIFMHNSYVQGVSQEYVGMSLRQGFGISLSYLDFGSVGRTTISNPSGAGLGTTGMTDTVASFGYGVSIFNWMSAGVAAKLIHEAIDGTSAQGYAADFGALADVPATKGLRVGMALQNIGPAARFQGAREQLPFNARFGAAYRFHLAGRSQTVAVDVAKTRSESAVVAAGFETTPVKALALRIGFNNRNEAGVGVTAGLGWRFSNLSLDYAFAPYGELSDSHRFSVAVRWGAESVRPLSQ